MESRLGLETNNVKKKFLKVPSIYVRNQVNNLQSIISFKEIEIWFIWYFRCIFGPNLGSNSMLKFNEKFKKCHLCGRFQDFWKKVRQVINIKGFPYLSERYCSESCRRIIILSQLWLPEKLAKIPEFWQNLLISS